MLAISHRGELWLESAGAGDDPRPATASADSAARRPPAAGVTAIR